MDLNKEIQLFVLSLLSLVIYAQAFSYSIYIHNTNSKEVCREKALFYQGNKTCDQIMCPPQTDLCYVLKIFDAQNSIIGHENICYSQNNTVLKNNTYLSNCSVPSKIKEFALHSNSLEYYGFNKVKQSVNTMSEIKQYVMTKKEETRLNMEEYDLNIAKAEHELALKEQEEDETEMEIDEVEENIDNIDDSIDRIDDILDEDMNSGKHEYYLNLIKEYDMKKQEMRGIKKEMKSKLYNVKSDISKINEHIKKIEENNREKMKDIELFLGSDVGRFCAYMVPSRNALIHINY